MSRGSCDRGVVPAKENKDSWLRDLKACMRSCTRHPRLYDSRRDGANNPSKILKQHIQLSKSATQKMLDMTKAQQAKHQLNDPLPAKARLQMSRLLASW